MLSPPRGPEKGFPSLFFWGAMGYLNPLSISSSLRELPLPYFWWCWYHSDQEVGSESPQLLLHNISWIGDIHMETEIIGFSTIHPKRRVGFFLPLRSPIVPRADLSEDRKSYFSWLSWTMLIYDSTSLVPLINCTGGKKTWILSPRKANKQTLVSGKHIKNHFSYRQEDTF